MNCLGTVKICIVIVWYLDVAYRQVRVKFCPVVYGNSEVRFSQVMLRKSIVES